MQACTPGESGMGFPAGLQEGAELPIAGWGFSACCAWAEAHSWGWWGGLKTWLVVGDPVTESGHSLTAASPAGHSQAVCDIRMSGFLPILIKARKDPFLHFLGKVLLWKGRWEEEAGGQLCPGRGRLETFSVPVCGTGSGLCAGVGKAAGEAEKRLRSGAGAEPQQAVDLPASTGGW